MEATRTQQPSLKALAMAVLARNIERNDQATGPEKCATNHPAKSPSLLRELRAGYDLLHVITVSGQGVGSSGTAIPQTSPSPASGSADHYHGEPEPCDTVPVKEEIIRAGIVWAAHPRCYACQSTNLWTTTQGDTRCRRCHPPAPGAEET